MFAHMGLSASPSFFFTHRKQQGTLCWGMSCKRASSGRILGAPQKRGGVWPHTALLKQYGMLGGDVSNKKSAASDGTLWRPKFGSQRATPTSWLWNSSCAPAGMQVVVLQQNDQSELRGTCPMPLARALLQYSSLSLGCRSACGSAPAVSAAASRSLCEQPLLPPSSQRWLRLPLQWCPASTHILECR